MVDGNIEDDNYVANLLKKDAEKAAKRYELVGIDAFNPKRCVPSLLCGASGFLPQRNIISCFDCMQDAHSAYAGQDLELQNRTPTFCDTSFARPTVIMRRYLQRRAKNHGLGYGR